MNFKFESLVAFRTLRSKKTESAISVTSWLALIAMALSVATLIVVMSVMNGFHDKLLGRILGLNGHMHIQGFNGKLKDYDTFRINLEEKTPSVRAIVPMIETQALASTQSSNPQGVMVRGLEPDDFKMLTDFVGQDLKTSVIVSGSIKSLNGKSIAIGKDLARHMNVIVGDSISLTSPHSKASPFGSIPRQGRYKVAAIFDMHMYEYDNGFIFMPLSAAQVFTGLGSGFVQSLDVFLNDSEELDNARNIATKEMLGEARVYDWRDINKGFFDTLQLESNVMFLILSLIIMISVFTIVSTMVMLVKEKSADIAILRTMGARRSSILRIFIAIGAAIGLAGTTIGAIIGVLFAANIDDIRKFIEATTGARLWDIEVRGLSEMPATIDTTEVFFVVGISMFLALLATIYPAWRAASVEPVEALRYG